MKIRSRLTIPLIIAVVLLVLPVAHNFPPWYYIFLRWTVFLCAFCAVIKSFDLKMVQWVWIFAAIGILFNPAVLFSFPRKAWKAIDLISAAAFFAAIFRISENPGNYLVYGKRGIDRLAAALHPCELPLEKEGQKFERKYLETPAFDPNSLAKAIGYFTKAIRLNLKHAAGYFNRAYSYLVKGDFQRSADDCTEAINLNSQDVAAYSYRGYAYEKLGETEKAINDYTRAIELSRESSSFLLFKRGDNYRKSGNPQKAAEDFYQSALLSLKQDDRAQAAKYLDEMKQTDPSSPLITKLNDRLHIQF